MGVGNEQNQPVAAEADGAQRRSYPTGARPAVRLIRERSADPIGDALLA
jgi:hypothetical protein